MHQFNGKEYVEGRQGIGQLSVFVFVNSPQVDALDRNLSLTSHERSDIVESVESVESGDQIEGEDDVAVRSVPPAARKEGSGVASIHDRPTTKSKIGRRWR